MNHHVESDELVISLEGHIRKDNAPAVQEEVLDIIAAHPGKKVVFDATRLHYISSAGLRMLLMVQKQREPEKVTVRNVVRGVYDVFEMTGFTKILNIRKKIRRISVDGFDIIGQGQSSTVYRVGDDIIVKLYNKGVPLEKIYQEIDYSKKAFLAGIPTAISFDMVEADNAYGAIFEMVDHADTIGHVLTTRPDDFDSIMEKFVATYKTIHSTDIQKMGGLASIKDTWNRWADGMQANGSFTAAETAMLKEMIAVVPERPTMVHCDYHAGNVLYQRDEIVVIDMADIGYGHPVFDLAGGAFHARYSYFPKRQKIHGMDQAGMLRFWDTLLRLYFGIRDGKQLQEIKEMCDAFGLLRGALFPMKHAQLDPETKAFHIAQTREHLFPRMDWAMAQARKLEKVF